MGEDVAVLAHHEGDQREGLLVGLLDLGLDVHEEGVGDGPAPRPDLELVHPDHLDPNEPGLRLELRAPPLQRLRQLRVDDQEDRVGLRPQLGHPQPRVRDFGPLEVLVHHDFVGRHVQHENVVGQVQPRLVVPVLVAVVAQEENVVVLDADVRALEELEVVHELVQVVGQENVALLLVVGEQHGLLLVLRQHHQRPVRLDQLLGLELDVAEDQVVLFVPADHARRSQVPDVGREVRGDRREVQPVAEVHDPRGLPPDEDGVVEKVLVHRREHLPLHDLLGQDAQEEQREQGKRASHDGII